MKTKELDKAKQGAISQCQVECNSSPAIFQSPHLASMVEFGSYHYTRTLPGRESETSMPTMQSIAQRKTENINNTGLPDQLKTGIESLSGMSMDDVKVHYNSSRPAQLNALAYAQGRDIHLAPGQEQHLPHEAWHVVQQAQGRVQPSMQMKSGAVINDDVTLEKEADRMGEKAMSTAPTFAFLSDRVTGADRSVAQLIRGHGYRENRYTEVEIADNDNTDVDDLTRAEKTLTVVDDDEMVDADARSTTETGYKVLRLEGNEQQADWQIAGAVLQWTAPRTLSTRDNFSLPVSCIESAEHVVQSLHNGGAIPDYDPDNPAANNVSLHFKHVDNDANEEAVNISNNPISDIDFDDFENFDFGADEIEVGQGLLVIDPDNVDESLHAVVVVGKNTVTGQIIVLERNAGTTTGDNMFVDDRWLVNVYDSPAGFLDSMEGDFMIGKLVAN